MPVISLTLHLHRYRQLGLLRHICRTNVPPQKVQIDYSDCCHRSSSPSCDYLIPSAERRSSLRSTGLPFLLYWRTCLFYQVCRFLHSWQPSLAQEGKSWARESLIVGRRRERTHRSTRWTHSGPPSLPACVRRRESRIPSRPLSSRRGSAILVRLPLGFLGPVSLQLGR